MASTEYNNMVRELNVLMSSSIPSVTQDKFFTWVKNHSLLFQKEQYPFSVTSASIPAQLSVNDYNFFSKYISPELKRCYRQVESNYELVTSPISNSDATKIFCSICLRKRNVVWVDFGFNVGNEFGGKHPALILHNVGNKTLIVAPISTNNTDKVADSETIVFEAYDFYNMPSLRKRFTVVNRITPISVYRIDVLSPTGNLNSAKFNEVITKFKNYIN